MRNIDKYKNPEKRKEYIQEWRERNREKCRNYFKIWYEKHYKKYRKDNIEKFQSPDSRIKSRAREQLRYHVKNGNIKKELCEICNQSAHAHHDDYSKPLEVRWLCSLHHNQLHKGTLKLQSNTLSLGVRVSALPRSHENCRPLNPEYYRVVP